MARKFNGLRTNTVSLVRFGFLLGFSFRKINKKSLKTFNFNKIKSKTNSIMIDFLILTLNSCSTTTHLKLSLCAHDSTIQLASYPFKFQVFVFVKFNQVPSTPNFESLTILLS